MHSTIPLMPNLTLVSKPYAGVSSESNTSILFSNTLYLPFDAQSSEALASKSIFNLSIIFFPLFELVSY